MAGAQRVPNERASAGLEKRCVQWRTGVKLREYDWGWGVLTQLTAVWWEGGREWQRA